MKNKLLLIGLGIVFWGGCKSVHPVFVPVFSIEECQEKDVYCATFHSGFDKLALLPDFDWVVKRWGVTNRVYVLGPSHFVELANNNKPIRFVLDGSKTLLENISDVYCGSCQMFYDENSLVQSTEQVVLHNIDVIRQRLFNMRLLITCPNVESIDVTDFFEIVANTCQIEKDSVGVFREMPPFKPVWSYSQSRAVLPAGPLKIYEYVELSPAVDAYLVIRQICNFPFVVTEGSWLTVQYYTDDSLGHLQVKGADGALNLGIEIY